ncbi:lipase member M-like [Neopelma chrysocephalum]|uniref:lipase member M-like n=1 Tax=Neopelma chrysocephalum TaxID=114329 RepID=UPI000FCD029F|nr:lipase member M-like [Neopelma chrysocephalum]
MWLLLVALCLPQGLGSAIPIAEELRNPERFMNISQKIRFQGYPSEEYEVTTEDGYILSLNRIPHGRGGAGHSASRTPVLIVHGFSLDGGDWVDNLPNNSLAFILADAGYDVWIGNNRGNSWSRGHLFLSVHQEKFWDFSFHEMAIYDLPAMVGFIIMQTEQEKLFYVGHAQGSSLGFIAFSSLPHLGEKIKLFFALTPGYTLNHIRSPVLKVVFLPDEVLKLRFGTKELSLVSRKDRALLAERCSIIPLDELCENEIFLVGGYNKDNLNASRLDVYLAHFPDYTSVKTLLHWGQTAKTGEFKQFDYGILKNLEKYHQSHPPFYRIEDMTVPVALWSGGQDWVNTPREINHLLRRLSSVIRHEQFPDWNHFDFHWGLDAAQRLYSQMLSLMGQYS